MLSHMALDGKPEPGWTPPLSDWGARLPPGLRSPRPGHGPSPDWLPCGLTTNLGSVSVPLTGSQCCTSANYMFYCLVCRYILSASTIKQIHLLHGRVRSCPPAAGPPEFEVGRPAGASASEPTGLCPPGEARGSPLLVSPCQPCLPPATEEPKQELLASLLCVKRLRRFAGCPRPGPRSGRAVPSPFPAH